MTTLALSSITIETDIVRHTCILVDTLNVQYPLRQVELDLFPSTFYQQLVEESPQYLDRKAKAPTTMPRKTFDSLFKAAARCANGDTSSSVVKLDGLALRHFHLDSCYSSSLFWNGKVVVPHDAVFLVLFHLRVYANLCQTDLKSLTLNVCAFVTAKIVKRFLRVVDQALTLSTTTSQPPSSILDIKMSSFGLIPTAAASYIRQTFLTDKSNVAHSMQDSNHIREHDQHLHDDAAVAPHSIENQDVSDCVATASGKTEISELSTPSTPRASKFRISRPIPSSPLANHGPYRATDFAHSPPSPFVIKRLSERDVPSFHPYQRISKDFNQERQSGHAFAELSKGGSTQRRRHAVRSDRKQEEEQFVFVKQNEGQEALDDLLDDGPQTSPVTKAMPGSFLSRGERLEGKRIIRDMENGSSKRGL